jgi:hypothetical protein
MIGTTCVKLKPESTTTMHCGGGIEGCEKRPLNGARDAAIRVEAWVSDTLAGSFFAHTSTPIVREALVFLKNELIVSLLNVRKIEIGLGDQQRGFCGVNLRP